MTMHSIGLRRAALAFGLVVAFSMPLAAAVPQVVNTATISSATNDPAPENNAATAVTGVSVVSVPTVSGVGLVVLALVLGAGALVLSRRRRAQH